MIPEAALSSFIAALFCMMNPIGNIGVFAGMTAQRSGNEVRRTAWTSAGAIAVTLLIVTWAGSTVLAFFGITIDSLRAVGGIIVLSLGCTYCLRRHQLHVWREFYLGLLRPARKSHFRRLRVGHRLSLLSRCC
jgi:small neutral amino acid transporter SnatA (MarC family)